MQLALPRSRAPTCVATFHICPHFENGDDAAGCARRAPRVSPDVDLTHAYVTATDAQKVVAIFCMVWPFLAMASLPRRGQSPAPLLAAIVALAVVGCGLWVDLANAAGAAVSTRDAFAVTRIALWPLAWIAVYALILRHRPRLDPFVITLAVCLALHVLAAVLFVQVLAPSKPLIVFARAAAAVMIVTAMTAALRLFFATRVSALAPQQPLSS